jgi:multiple sugar transport system substrate-binding protein
LLTALAGGSGPDTARLDIAWVPEFADQEALLQLDGKMPGFEDLAAKTFPGPLSTNFWNGHYYGLPQNTNTQVLLWNKVNFDAAGIKEPPKTMEEFVDVVCKLTDAKKEQYGYALGGTYFWAPAPIFYTMGGQVVDKDITTATGYVNSPKSVAAFTLLKDLYDKGCISPNLLGGGIYGHGHATGKCAMIIDGRGWWTSKGELSIQRSIQLHPTGGWVDSSVVGGEDVVIFADSSSPGNHEVGAFIDDESQR